MSITSIYSKYQILPSLQLHLKRVAAVTSIICDHISDKVDKQTCVKAALLHDIGNIIKFNLNFFPEFIKAEGIEYWQQVKQMFIEKYGSSEHEASVKIASELGVSPRILELINKVSFSRTSENIKLNDIELNIIQYADNRVNPEGIVSLKTRLTSGVKRFIANKGSSKDDIEIFEKNSKAFYTIEQQIFRNCTILPKNITDTAANRIIDSGIFDRMDF